MQTHAPDMRAEATSLTRILSSSAAPLPSAWSPATHIPFSQLPAEACPAPAHLPTQP